jgi:hypothetical protein
VVALFLLIFDGAMIGMVILARVRVEEGRHIGLPLHESGGETGMGVKTENSDSAPMHNF